MEQAHNNYVIAPLSFSSSKQASRKVFNIKILWKELSDKKNWLHWEEILEVVKSIGSHSIQPDQAFQQHRKVCAT